MKGEDKILLQLMDGSDNRFVIPVYQRNYDWKESNCKQLYKDLLDVVETKRQSHFFGGIVRATLNGGGPSDYIIIDGQQRLTTITLLLLAIYRNIEEGNIEVTDNILAKKIWNKYIIDEYQPGERKIRLKPVNDDCTAFDKLIFCKKEDYIYSSNVTSNYLFFYEKINNISVPVEQLYEAISKLVVIDIYLNKDDDPQLIFESLNSTGLDLTEADKIRNFILMGISPDLQQKYYYEYWNKIEKNTTYDQVSTFIRDYLTIKTGKINSIKSVYFAFKQYMQKDLKINDVLQEMLEYSIFYRQITFSATENEEWNKIFIRLNQLDVTVVYSFLLPLLRYSEQDIECKNKMVDILSAVESFLFRRTICGVPTNALNKIFSSLHNDVLKKKEKNSYYSVLVYILQSKAGSSRFPNNDEFSQNFVTKNIYIMQSKNKAYLFDRLENGESKETNDILSLMKDKVLTIEHVMPQKLNNSWKEKLGVDYERIYNERLNTISNLTLTGYNSTYKNRPFLEKKDIENGFKDSNLRLNKFFLKCENWTEVEMKERQSQLLKNALILWKYPETNYVPLEKNHNSVLLSEDFDFKGFGLKSFYFQGTEYKINNWADAILEIVKLLSEIEKAPLYSEALTNSWFANTPKKNNFKKVIDNVYFSTNSNTNAKINILKKLFNLYQIEENELEFILK